MKEKQLKFLVKEILKASGWIGWWPPKVRWYTNSDIFGVFDLIACKNGRIKLIQVTTAPNRASRRRKMQTFMFQGGGNLGSKAWLWSYNVNKKYWITENVTYPDTETIDRLLIMNAAAAEKKKRDNANAL